MLLIFILSELRVYKPDSWSRLLTIPTFVALSILGVFLNIHNGCISRRRTLGYPERAEILVWAYIITAIILTQTLPVVLLDKPSITEIRLGVRDDVLRLLVAYVYADGLWQTLCLRCTSRIGHLYSVFLWWPLYTADSLVFGCLSTGRSLLYTYIDLRPNYDQIKQLNGDTSGSQYTELSGRCSALVRKRSITTP